MPDGEFDFEHVLDEALATYADPQEAGQPRLLTAHVLAAVEARQRKRRLWWSLAVAMPVAACLLLAALILQPGRNISHPQIAYQPATPVAQVKLPRETPQAVVRPQRVHEPVRVAALPARNPKLAHFPTPQPLSEQERLLIAFATQVPPSEQEEVIKAQQEAEKPLHISQMEIAPIDINPIHIQP